MEQGRGFKENQNAQNQKETVKKVTAKKVSLENLKLPGQIESKVGRGKQEVGETIRDKHYFAVRG